MCSNVVNEIAGLRASLAQEFPVRDMVSKRQHPASLVRKGHEVAKRTDEGRKFFLDMAERIKTRRQRARQADLYSVDAGKPDSHGSNTTSLAGCSDVDRHSHLPQDDIDLTTCVFDNCEVLNVDVSWLRIPSQQMTDASLLQREIQGADDPADDVELRLRLGCQHKGWSRLRIESEF
jgi:hypothetical protein